MSSKNSETRNKILKACVHLLETSQGKEVRMTDIARHAGISRQALYLHFATRAELLIATTHYVDELLESEKRLAASRTAETGIQRLDAYIEAWGSYIPEVYGIAGALLAMKDTDEAAAKAWNERMEDMREGCEAAINALQNDKTLSPAYSPDEATDILWTMLSIRNWELLCIERGWSQKKYLENLKSLARRAFLAS